MHLLTEVHRARRLPPEQTREGIVGRGLFPFGLAPRRLGATDHPLSGEEELDEVVGITSCEFIDIGHLFGEIFPTGISLQTPNCVGHIRV